MYSFVIQTHEQREEIFHTQPAREKLTFLHLPVYGPLNTHGKRLPSLSLFMGITACSCIHLTLPEQLNIFKFDRGTTVNYNCVSGNQWCFGCGRVAQVAGRHSQSYLISTLSGVGGLHMAPPPSGNPSPNACSREGLKKAKQEKSKWIEQKVEGCERSNPRVCIWHSYSACTAVRLHFKDDIFWLRYQVLVPAFRVW